MNNNTPDYEYKQINTGDIFVDETYQRGLKNSRVDRIVKKFNPYLVNACKVSFRDGKYWVFDGQHTIAAIKKVRGDRDTVVDCKVFYGLTQYEEMELFIEQNGEFSAVGTNDRFRAMYNQGNEDVCGMVHAVESIGLKIDFTCSKATNKIVALMALMKSYKSMEKNKFIDMLSIIKRAWDGMPEGFTAEILGGMTRFYNTYDGYFKRERLINKLSKANPIAIVRDGKIVGSGGPARYARIILSVYNNGASTNRLEDKL